MKAIVSVIGKDKVGIISKVTTSLAGEGVNVLDISQTILNEYFTMLMVVDIPRSATIASVQATMNEVGSEIGVSILVQHEDIFNTMHKL